MLLQDYKEIAGAASVIIVILNHCYYLSLTYRQRIRPHPFPIAVYFVITIVVALGMMQEGDKMAALRMAVPAPLYILIFWYSVRRRIEYVRRIDVVMLILAILGLPLLFVTENPRLAILFLAMVEGVGMIPAFRKAYVLPHEDSIISPMISAVAMLLAAIAVENPQAAWATVSYLVYWVVLCTALAGLIFWRRRVAIVG